MYQPLTKQNAGERIAERLVTAIALGQFVPGQRLPAERELAELLGVSRSSVRDAIARLCASGYLEVRRGRTGGAFVTTEWGPESDSIVRSVLLPDWERLKQLLDFRCGVEAEVARLAAQRRTPDEARAIERAAQAYLDSGTDRESSRDADQALHQAIAAATHNVFWEQLSVQVRHEVTFGLGSEPFNAGLRKRAEDQHPQLAEAVASGRAEHAAKVARNHFALNIETITELLASVSEAEVDRRSSPLNQMNQMNQPVAHEEGEP
jgi:GntR family transcriptional repressor for pyruvate dehydrogenase complex